MRVLLLTILHILLITSAADAGRIFEGKVKAVYDGDTVLLISPGNSRIKVRLYGIDAPETRKPDKPGQPNGDVSGRALKSKVLGRRVSAEVMDVDKYSRTVAVLRIAGKDINREMVEDGMAWAYRQYLHSPYESKYIDSEKRARSSRIGIWRERNPVPPWEFRHGSSRRGKSSRSWR